jgi:hypothetical protein
MVNTSETASYDDTGSAQSLHSSNVNDDFHKIHVEKSKRSKFVATCYCSRRPGLPKSNMPIFQIGQKSSFS